MTVPSQDDVERFLRRNFPRQPVEHRALLLAEETGEICRAVLKRSQGVRGTVADWTAEIRKEAADVYIGLLALAAIEDFSLEDEVARRWTDVERRDFVVDPIQQGLPNGDAW